MKPTSFVKSISSRLSLGRRPTSSAVAPLPEQSRFAEDVTAKLDACRSSYNECTSSSWLVGVLDATISTQIVAQECLSANNFILSNVGRQMIDDYLEANTELLDACNGLVEKMGLIQKYVDSLSSAIRLLDGAIEPNFVTLSRTQEMLKECNTLEGQCATLDKCSPKLHRLMGQKIAQLINNNIQDQELHEVLSGSKEIVSMGCHILQRALSFKSRQGLMKNKSKLPTTWSSSLNQLQTTMNNEAEKRKKSTAWMMKELEQMVMDAKMVHDQVKSEKRNVDIDSLRRNCEAVEEGLSPLEERVKELYRHLISVRMTLLGILSQN